MTIKNVITKIKSVICALNLKTIFKNAAKSAIKELEQDLLDAVKTAVKSAVTGSKAQQ